MSELPADYAERVYAGVLGKIIGVYLGRPFEGWSYERILAELGEITDYVHDRLGVPLVVADDDVSGTFTFLRALEDYGFSPELTTEQIGQTWLNYLIENRTVLWWGGMGMSTEHTAYLRLKHGVKSPHSGSAALNGKVVADQIGAQIFIDGWGMVCPGDPERAAHCAKLAAEVSHDGEATYGAQVVAGMEALAFFETDISKLLDTGLSLIPGHSVIAAVIRDVREWHASGLDWKAGFLKIRERYGYDKYGGNCHMVPNHALIIHALVHGGGDFSESLKIVNTCGWDTDCNSGNVGCLLGIRNGLAGIEERWRKPVNDRIYLPTADGGRCVTDAASEALRVVEAGRRLHGLESLPRAARFSFPFSCSTMGFSATSGALDSDGEGLLWSVPSGDSRLSVATFPPESDLRAPGYAILASPTLYPGQVLSAVLDGEVTGHLFIETRSGRVASPGLGAWTVPDTGGEPILSAGLEISADNPAVLRVRSFDWTGEPTSRFPRGEGELWKKAWVTGVSEVMFPDDEDYRLVQNEGTGLFIQGTREWRDYAVRATVCPHLCEEAGIAARVQGMQRYYALLLGRDGVLRLVRQLDGREVLAEALFPWEFGQSISLQLEVFGEQIRGYVDGKSVLVASDARLTSGAIALVLAEGRVAYRDVTVRPSSE
jgi:ADP-ribosylglycohydrolase